MRVNISVFFKVKGSEEQLEKLESLINKYEDDAEKFGNEVAKLATANDSDDWDPEVYKDYEYPGEFANGCELDDDVLEFELDSYIDINSLLPDNVCAFGYMLDTAFPGIETNWMYRCDEAGKHGVFAKGGDSIDDFWAANYVVECDGGDLEEWCESLDELIDAVSDYTGNMKLKSYKDCVKALEKYCEENEIEDLIISEFLLP